MPNLSGIPAIDVAIGLAFLFFLLSIVCSSINEGVATILKLRAKTLEEGVVSMLGDEQAAKDFYAHWRIDQLMRNGRKPSYIPSRTFALTVLEKYLPYEADVAAVTREATSKAEEAVLAVKDLDPGVKDTVAEGLKLLDQRLSAQSSDAVLLQRARAKVESGGLPDPVKHLLEDALAVASNAVTTGEQEALRFRRAIERSFDEVMDRASGWYKRRAQWFLLVIAIVVALALNADTIAIGQQLWRNDSLRAVVAGQATKALPAGQTCDTNANDTPVQVAAKCLQDVRQLNLPLGWATGLPHGWGYPSKLLGLLITAFALTLGAPFWFDLLSKVATLRGTGPPAPGSEQKAAQTRKTGGSA